MTLLFLEEAWSRYRNGCCTFVTMIVNFPGASHSFSKIKREINVVATICMFACTEWMKMNVVATLLYPLSILIESIRNGWIHKFMWFRFLQRSFFALIRWIHRYNRYRSKWHGTREDSEHEPRQTRIVTAWTNYLMLFCFAFLCFWDSW